MDYRPHEIDILNTSLLDHLDLDIYIVQIEYSKLHIFYQVTRLLGQKYIILVIKV